MDEKNKYTSYKHTPIQTDRSIVEENDIKEAEDILKEQNEMQKNVDTLHPANNEIDKLINSQSLSVIFQDINESQAAKFNALKAPENQILEAPENDWSSIHRPEYPRNTEYTKPNKQHFSEMVDNEKEGVTSQDGVLEIKINKPSKTPIQTKTEKQSVFNDIGKLRNEKVPSPSKTNTAVMHSARSENKAGTPKSKSPRKVPKKNNHEVAKDKLFYNEADNKNFEFSDFVRKSEDGDYRSKNEWYNNRSKPGVDVSEFYNPSQMQDENKNHSFSKILSNNEDGMKITDARGDEKDQSVLFIEQSDIKGGSLHHSLDIGHNLSHDMYRPSNININDLKDSPK